MVARFKRGNSAYEGGETIADVLSEMDRLGIGGGVLSKAPRDITPPFVHATKTGEGVLRERVSGWPGINVTTPADS